MAEAVGYLASKVDLAVLEQRLIIPARPLGGIMVADAAGATDP
jgi:hypothetical protein